MEALRAGDPRRVGGYRLVGRLGAGGMGLVYLGRSPGGLMVAVKVVHVHLAEDADFRQRFRREAGAARAVSGAFTAPVVDADPDADPPWLATAYLPGMPLQEVVERYGPLPVPAVLALGAGLAEALVSVHRAGVVHRDLKPANVILGTDGPRVIDFGIAHAAEAATITGTGMAVGSPGFIAPEQARGEGTGPAADVFSLGAVLVHAATGEGPYGQGPPHMLIYRAAHEPPRVDGVTEPALRSLVADCLARDPAGRPTPARLLERLAPLVPQATDLNGLGWLPPSVAAGIAQAATRPPVPTDPGEGGGGRGPSRRRILVLGGAGAATAVTATVAGVLLWPEERPSAAPTRPSPSTGPTSAPPPQPVKVSKPVWRRNTGEEYLMTSPTVAGGTVFVGSEKGDLFAFDARTGKPRWRYATGQPVRSQAAIAGGVVYVAGHDGNVHAVDARTGTARWRRPVGHSESDIVLSGGLVFAGNDPFYALDASSGAIRWSATGGKNIVSDRAVAGAVVYVPRVQSLAALDKSSGRVRWTYGMSQGTGRPQVAGGVVYCGDFLGGKLHAIDARTGKRRWVYDLGGSVTARPAVANGVVYVGDFGGNLFAIDAARGTLRWQIQADGEIHDGAVMADGMLYFSAGITDDGVLHAVGAATGRVVWEFGMSGGVESAPAAADGMVYVACKDGYLYALDAKDGSGTPQTGS
ncbi:PQQ-binding-like beta-propeller repeat protein [Spirillospora sp. NPDC048911]|uniref:outer membrane protein assembly factor BamB family protein n=1 Tax=Spirillospora sp. NPDC048911 TaxID=3364527 RepID=UPI0037128ED0